MEMHFLLSHTNFHQRVYQIYANSLVSIFPPKLCFLGLSELFVLSSQTLRAPSYELSFHFAFSPNDKNHLTTYSNHTLPKN